MQFKLFPFALIILNCVDYSQCQANRWRRSKRGNEHTTGSSVTEHSSVLLSHRAVFGEAQSQSPGCRIENCDACFSRDFCTKCKDGYYSHKGRCFKECPEGFAPLDETMECVDGCEVGPWSEWGTCSRNNKTCGFKWGLETRTRQIVKKPAKDTIPCPTIAESRRCKMAQRHCPG
ncbi:hypothetical protein AB205_0186620, partial [Aquarana catesbeiana]